MKTTIVKATLRAVLAAAAAFIGMGMDAANIIWTGAENSNLLNANNWTNGAAEAVLPGTSDTACIGDAPEAVLSSGTATWTKLDLGTTAGKKGALSILGGSLTLAGGVNFYTTNGAESELTINGGNFTTKWLNTPDNASTTTVNLVSGKFTVNDWADWGRNANGKAVFNQSGGTLDLKKGFQMGRDNSGTGTYNMSGGVLNGSSGDYFIVGRLGGGTGRFNITAGTVNFGSKDVVIGGFDNKTTTTRGFFTQSGGTVTANGNVQVGRYGQGTFTQSGGSFTCKDYFSIGRSGGSSGTYTITGGTFAMPTRGLIVGEESTGALNVGGDATMNLPGGLYLGIRNSGKGTVVQDGGSVLSGGVVGVGSSATGFYTLKDGLLRADGGIIVGNDGKGTFEIFGGTVVTTNIMCGWNAGTGRVLLQRGTVRASASGNLLSNGNGTVGWTLGRTLTIDTDGYDTSAAGVDVAVADGASLTKKGEGTLTAAGSLLRADSVTVERGTLTLSADCDNTVAASLAHRWSFNGNVNDSVGSANGALAGGAVYTNDSTAVYLPGGAKGKGGRISLGKGVFAGDELTLEIWAKRVSAQRWSRVFECRNAAGDAILMMSWVRGTNSGQDKVSAYLDGVESVVQDKLVYDNTMCHISVRFRRNASGTTTITWTRRNPETGEVVKTCDTTYAKDGAGWSFDKLVTGEFFLGYSPYWDDNDANAIYDEVRIWHGALSDAALNLSAATGPDATGADISAIMAKNAESVTAKRSIELAFGTTLDLGGHTLAQPIVKGNGTVSGGTLNVTDSLVVKCGETLLASGTVDLSDAKVELVDPENLMSTGSFTFLKAPAGQALTITGLPEAIGIPRGWRIKVDGTSGSIGQKGFTVIVR